MAQWIGTARSNYFRVKNEEAFVKEIESHELSFQRDNEGRFAVFSEHEYGGWPGWEYPEDDGEPVEIDVAEIVSGHLAPGEVAVLMEVGAEKIRYVTGYAVAVNDRNERRVVSLDTIYQWATELGEHVSQASY